MPMRTSSLLPAARIALALALLLAAVLAAPAAAQKRSYTLDEDPVRLGTRAFEENRLPDARTYFLEALANDYQPERAQLGLARIATLEGRNEDAEAFFRHAIDTQQKTGKEFPEARAGLGLLLLRLGRTAEANLEFDQALKEKRDLWEAKFGRAWVLLQEKQWEPARKLLDEGAKQKGSTEGEDLYHFGMALYHEGKGNTADAEREALTALNLNASYPEYARLVGRLYEARDAPALAIDAYERALAAPGMKPTAPMLRTLGSLYQKVERYNEARDRYLAAVQVDSTYAPALKDLGQLFQLAKQHERAASVYLRYVNLEPSDVDVLVGLAESCLAVGRNAQALEAADAAMALESGSIDVRKVYARAAIRSRDNEKKADAARILATLDEPKGLEVSDWIALAAFQTSRRQFAQASESVRAALALDPASANAYFQQGVIDLSQGRADAAVQQFETAIRHDPEVAGYHLNLGIAQFQRQDLAAAVPRFRRALELRPDLAVGRLLLAQALAATDSTDAAATQYQKILETDPQNAKALRGLGYCEIRSADYAAAVRAYRSANEIEGDNADGWAGLGNAHLGLRQLDEAARAFERARALDPQNATMLKGMELLEQARSTTGG